MRENETNGFYKIVFLSNIELQSSCFYTSNESGGHFMIKCKNVKWFLIVFSLLVIFVLPCVSFATSFSDFQPGNLDYTLKMSLDSHGSLDSDGTHNHRPSQQPQATPIPSPIWLLGTGIVGLLGISRRLKNWSIHYKKAEAMTPKLNTGLVQSKPNNRKELTMCNKRNPLNSRQSSCC
jgi:hypothetical protein